MRAAAESVEALRRPGLEHRAPAHRVLPAAWFPAGCSRSRGARRCSTHLVSGQVHLRRPGPHRLAAAARCPSLASGLAALPPASSPTENRGRMGNTGHRRACNGPKAASSLRIPPGSRPTAKSCLPPRPTKVPLAALWTLAAISSGAKPSLPPSLASPASHPLYPREPDRRRESIPGPVRPSLLALVRMTGTFPAGSIKASRLTPSVSNPPSGAVVGLFTRLRNRPDRPFWNNDSARFQEMCAADRNERKLGKSKLFNRCVRECNHRSLPILCQIPFWKSFPTAWRESMARRLELPRWTIRLEWVGCSIARY